jgi:pimeloyl-ACP methyl ester carboxylesterase
MPFLDIYLKYQRDSIGCDEAADLLGVSVSSFYRSRKRFDAEGEDGLVDRRLGKLSARRAPVVDGQQFTYCLFAQDIICLLASRGIHKTNVLGYSQSSVTTQNLLIYFPDRINKAVIHATSTDGKAVATAFKRIHLPDNPTIKKKLQAAMGWKTPLEKMTLIKNQVMLLVGAADTVVGTKSSKILASLIPGAWLVQFKGGTHHLQFEAPAAFTRIVMTFLDMDETVPAAHPKTQ